jgi:hypothetical protein
MLSFLKKDRSLNYIFSPYQSVHISDLGLDAETTESNFNESINIPDTVNTDRSIAPSKSTINCLFTSGG